MSTKLVKIVPGQISFEVDQVDGNKLIEVSLDKMRGEFTDRLIHFTSGTMNQIANLRDQIEALGSQLQFQLDRLQAIKENKFTTNRRGEIIFDEPRLNEGLY